MWCNMHNMSGSARRPALDEVERRARNALALSLCLRELTAEQAGERIGHSHNWVNSRKVGGTRIRPGDMELLAKALDVPAELFRWERAAVLKWFADEAAADEYAPRGSNPEPADSVPAPLQRATESLVAA